MKKISAIWKKCLPSNDIHVGKKIVGKHSMPKILYLGCAVRVILMFFFMVFKKKFYKCLVLNMYYFHDLKELL